MKPWLTLDSARTPDGAELTLQQRGDEFAIRAAGQVLMTSRSHGSEDQLASVALSGRKPSPKDVLVGGLGMGFTLRATLDKLGPNARVTVAELVPALVNWNRGPLAALAHGPLRDKRVIVVEGDVRTLLSPDAFDAILLDVDNGPTALTIQSNEALYSKRGLEKLRASLRPGGRLALWSAAPVPAFVKKMHESGFDARMQPAGARHVIFVGTRPGRAP
ncbi:MAG: hypothetical protein JST54_15680 [Deltaproteobacteria bacterium]|nr:hypothetical protein [Deltaproteobacteria bacterium]